MYLRFWTCRSFKSANHKKIGSAITIPQSVTFAEGPQAANLTSYLGPHIYGFAISGTYLLTAHLCQCVVLIK
jgi:hypothetical protein